MNEIVKVFENEEFGRVRTVSVNDEPWFVGKDVAEILGYSNPRDALAKHVDNEDKATVAIHDGSQNRNQTIINESGLYSLILSSKLPKAKAFKHWVTSEVLPTIRKTGGYVSNDDLFIDTYLPNINEETKNLFRLNLQTIRQLNGIIDAQKKKIEEDEPKVTYYELVLQTKDVLSVTQIAKDYGKSANWLNRWLHNNGIQYKVGNTWVLYQKFADKGYTKTKTDYQNDHTWSHTYWTQKGRLFIYENLKKQGILPVIEQE